MKYKIIIIEDHGFTRTGVSNYLNKEIQFEIIGEFSETRSLLNNTKNLNPDLILLDLNLPGLNGEASCKYLKQKFFNCKIVAFTQYVKNEKELIEFGFDGCYLKGEDPLLLIDVIQNVLNKGKYFSNITLASAPSHLDERSTPFLLDKKITNREIEIINLYLQDFTSKEISEQLYISEKTVNTHKRNFKSKIGKHKKNEIRILLEQNGVLK
jgi:two-component system nitrate/nitrite response regulator NarL